jgi:hypothetical protein
VAAKDYVAADMAGYADETDDVASADVARTDDVADATDALAWLG